MDPTKYIISLLAIDNNGIDLNFDSKQIEKPLITVISLSSIFSSCVKQHLIRTFPIIYFA